MKKYFYSPIPLGRLVILAEKFGLRFISSPTFFYQEKMWRMELVGNPQDFKNFDREYEILLEEFKNPKVNWFQHLIKRIKNRR